MLLSLALHLIKLYNWFYFCILSSSELSFETTSNFRASVVDNISVDAILVDNSILEIHVRASKLSLKVHC